MPTYVTLNLKTPVNILSRITRSARVYVRVSIVFYTPSSSYANIQIPSPSPTNDLRLNIRGVLTELYADRKADTNFTQENKLKWSSDNGSYVKVVTRMKRTLEWMLKYLSAETAVRKAVKIRTADVTEFIASCGQTYKKERARTRVHKFYYCTKKLLSTHAFYRVYVNINKTIYFTRMVHNILHNMVFSPCDILDDTVQVKGLGCLC